MTSTFPSPPSLMAALRGGFDAIANNIVLILFPVILDVFLWLGPQLRMTRLVQSIVAQIETFYRVGDSGGREMLEASQEMWALLAQHFNLFAAARSYPVGVFSLMASRLPVETPLGERGGWELSSFGEVILAWLLISLAGVVLATLYFSLVSQAALQEELSWRQALERLPRASIQMVLLGVFWLVLLALVSVPASILFSLVVLGGTPLVLCGLVLFGVLLIMVLLPLVFTAHGVIANDYNVFQALKASMRLTRLTMPTTSLFFLLAIFLSEAMSLLWRAPAEDSWFSLVGVFGHAFITTGLLSASFLYYRDAGHWVRSMVHQFELGSMRDVVEE